MHAGNFDSVEEQQAFASDTASFLKTVAKYHSYITGVLFSMLIGKRFLDAILKKELFVKILSSDLPLVIKGMMGIYLAFNVLSGILGFIQPLINVHLRYLFIDLLLSVIG